MKNLVIILLAVFSFAISNDINAQDMASADVVSYTKSTTGEVEILTNFKANKTQKKVIKKIQKYVTPRVLGNTPNASALEGKTVKVQVNFDAMGAISNVAVVNGIAPQLDNKVVSLVKEFDAKSAIVDSNLTTPSAIQLDVKLVNKNYGAH